MTEKILLVIESGIGNVIFLTPLIKALHIVYEKPEITLLSSRYRQEGRILEGWKYLKKCIYTANGLDPNYFDKVLISPMYGNIFNYYLCKVPKGKLMAMKTGGIDWHREHEVDVNMTIARKLGYSGATPSTEVSIKKPTNYHQLNNKLKIGFHTGCLNHENYKQKMWTNKKWDDLAKKLEKEFNAQIIWFGSKEKPYPGKNLREQDYAGKIGLDLVGKFQDIRETAYMISKCDIFISLDSGLSHIANALHIPTIALFGPTIPSKNHPWNPGYNIISSNSCKSRPCYFTERYASCKDNKCMQDISINEIIEYITKTRTRKIKICLVACRQLGDSLRRTLSGMDKIDFFYYDY